MMLNAMTGLANCVSLKGDNAHLVNPNVSSEEVLTIRNRQNNAMDDLTGTIFAGNHQPLKIWILCLYFMGLNLSNQQIARELDLNRSDVQQMTTQLREGVEKKDRP